MSIENWLVGHEEQSRLDMTNHNAFSFTSGLFIDEDHDACAQYLKIIKKSLKSKSLINSS